MSEHPRVNSILLIPKVNLRNQWYESKNMYLLAASSASKEETECWVAEIEEAFPDFQVMCDNLSLGVCCHTGQGALGIGFSAKIAIDS